MSKFLNLVFQYNLYYYNIINSDEPELEFSARAKLGSPLSWFQSILWSFIWTFVFLKVNDFIQMHNLVNFLIENNRK